MKEGTRNFMVGLFVLASLSLLAILMVWFGETPSWLQRGEWNLRILGVREIRGIGEGTPALMNGVEIGRVSGLGFEDRNRPGRGVVIALRIKQRFAVPRGASAKVYGATLGIGTGRIQIVLPAQETEPLEKDGFAVIPGEMANMLAEVIPADFTTSIQRAFERFSDLATAARPAAENLSRLIEPRPVASLEAPDAKELALTANLSTAIERFDVLVGNVNSVLGDPAVQADLKSVAGDLRAAAEGLKETVDVWKQESRKLSTHLNDGVSRTDRNLQTLLEKLIAVADRLDASAKDVNVVTGRVAAGQGSIGLMVHDPRLYEAATLSFDRMSELLATINRIAGKIEQDGYITVGQKTVVGTFTKDFPVGAGD
jgi:ABC-type transporter Mla subunit MlaD